MTARESVRGYPRLNPTFVPVVTEEAVHFRAGPWSGPIYTLESDTGTDQLVRLLELLDGTHPTTEIADRIGEPLTDLEAVLDQLHQNGIIVESAAPDRKDDTSAIGGYLRLADHLPEGSTEQLATTAVLLIADGELGRITEEQLDRLGIETTTVLPVDRDDPAGIEETALERAITATDFAVVTAAGPRPSLLKRIDTCTQDHETPWIVGQLQGYDGLIGPTVIPGESPCYGCYNARARANVRAPESFGAFETLAESASRPPGPGLSAFSAIIAGHLAIETMTWVCAGVANTVGRVLHYDFHDLSVEASDVLRLPRCPVCQTAELPDTPRHVSLGQLLDTVHGEMPDA
ncbi:MAG: TOMM precursor leader peptide-binding protein [Halobacteriales archaeon]|nr:TOMM precursor leader peptide-binding protein [Halobacteriales archaeon]